MKRPSKKDIKAAVEKLKNASTGGDSTPDQPVTAPSAKKANKNRIRKQGV